MSWIILEKAVGAGAGIVELYWRGHCAGRPDTDPEFCNGWSLDHGATGEGHHHFRDADSYAILGR